MKKQKQSRHFLSRSLLKAILPGEEYLEKSGDLEEAFSDQVEETGLFRAKIWLGWQVVKALPVLLHHRYYWRLVMFKNYLKMALRGIRKHKGFSFINISGLAIGFSCCILIFLWVKDELGYDRFHEKANHLYIATFSNGSVITPNPLAGALKSDYPEITETSRFASWGTLKLTAGEKSFMEEGSALVDPGFFQMFTLPFIYGQAEAPFSGNWSMVISQSLAEKYFGTANPVGETITINNKYDFKITGVIADYPRNSYLRFSYLIPFEIYADFGVDLSLWPGNSIRTYVLLQDGTNVKEVDSKISGLVEKHVPQDKRALSLQPLTRLHLHNFSGGGPIVYVYIFSALAVFIMLIACINFMNLTTAKSITRAKEVGTRKAVGATQHDLMRQFFSESFLMTLLSLLCSLGLVYLLLPVFNNLSAKNFTMGEAFRFSTLWGIFLITGLTGILAGSYPAVFLSAFRPAQVLQGTIRVGKGRLSFRQALVVIQFTFSIFLIIGTAVVFSQLNHMKTRELGFSRENIIHLGLMNSLRPKIETIKTELRQHPNILAVSVTSNPPYTRETNAGSGDVHWEGQQSGQITPIHVTSVDYDFLRTFSIPLAEGRFFSPEYPTDKDDAFVVNEAAVRAMEMTSPVGKRLKIWEEEGSIIGVVKDYHFRSLHHEVEPLALRIIPEWDDNICIRIRPVDIPGTLQFLESEWKGWLPDYPFSYYFMDDSLNNLYGVEQRLGTIFRYFTFLAIFISCLGLLGLSSYMAEQRTREIGIRKVLGARISGIVFLLSKGFVKWVAAANLIAWPAAYYFMRRWLDNFAIRIELSISFFLGSALLAFCIAALTVGFQSLKAARANPAITLKHE